MTCTYEMENHLLRSLKLHNKVSEGMLARTEKNELLYTSCERPKL